MLHNLSSSLFIVLLQVVSLLTRMRFSRQLTAGQHL
jgi:hypothetical protein